MKKNGFTLIEVLAVVILLGVIAVISVPVVRNTIKDSKQKLYDEQINQMELGLKNWSNANVFSLPDVDETIKMSLGQLKQSGYAEIEIINPKTNKCFSNESILSITKYNNSYIYEVDEVIDVECDLIEESPIIKLNGSIIDYLYIGDTYTEMGATAKSKAGADLTSNITTTISGSGSSIDTSKEGTYYITYKVTNDNKTTTAIRTVIVKKPGYKNEIMTSLNNCINGGICPNGTKVNVKVNSTENYDFYVIGDTGSVLTLIMDRNLGGNVAWYNGEENTSGPITALNALKTRTNLWTYVQEVTISTYDDELGNEHEMSETITTHARMLTYNEALSLGCPTTSDFDDFDTCPDYLKFNIYSTGDTSNYGYWLSTASSSKTNRSWSLYNYDEGDWWTLYLYSGMSPNGLKMGPDNIDTSLMLGVRPVIKITK